MSDYFYRCTRRPSDSGFASSLGQSLDRAISPGDDVSWDPGSASSSAAGSPPLAFGPEPFQPLATSSPRMNRSSGSSPPGFGPFYRSGERELRLWGMKTAWNREYHELFEEVKKVKGQGGRGRTGVRNSNRICSPEVDVIRPTTVDHLNILNPKCVLFFQMLTYDIIWFFLGKSERLDCLS